MKKLVILMIVAAMTMSLMACGGEPEETLPPAPETIQEPVATPEISQPEAEEEFPLKIFGDLIINLPKSFGEVTVEKDIFVSPGPNSSITVTPALDIDLMPEEWDEEFAAASLEPLYGSVYTNLELLAFKNDFSLNGNEGVYLYFFGTNSQGVDRMVQVVRLYNDDLTKYYVISFIHGTDDDFFTPEMDAGIINSITLME